MKITPIHFSFGSVQKSASFESGGVNKKRSFAATEIRVLERSKRPITPLDLEFLAKAAVEILKKETTENGSQKYERMYLEVPLSLSLQIKNALRYEHDGTKFLTSTSGNPNEVRLPEHIRTVVDVVSEYDQLEGLGKKKVFVIDTDLIPEPLELAHGKIRIVDDRSGNQKKTKGLLEMGRESQTVDFAGLGTGEQSPSVQLRNQILQLVREHRDKPLVKVLEMVNLPEDCNYIPVELGDSLEQVRIDFAKFETNLLHSS